MNPPVSSTVAGDPTTRLRRFEAVTEAVTIVQPMKAATNLRELTDQRLLLTRCRLFRHSRVLVAAAGVEEARAEKVAGAAASGASNPACSCAGRTTGLNSRTTAEV